MACLWQALKSDIFFSRGYIMKHVSSSASQITTQTLSAYREANKNAEKAQAGSAVSGTSLNVASRVIIFPFVAGHSSWQES